MVGGSGRVYDGLARTNREKAGMNGRRGLFLDLGDTLVRVEDDEIYTDASGQVEFLANRVATIQRVAGEFDAIFIVTNQASIEEGTVSFEAAKSYVDQVDAALGGLITDYWACPRRGSLYRKPNPGMIEGLADKHFIDVAQSIFVGDSESDQTAAKHAGIGEFIFAEQYFSQVQ